MLPHGLERRHAVYLSKWRIWLLPGSWHAIRRMLVPMALFVYTDLTRANSISSAGAEQPHTCHRERRMCESFRPTSRLPLCPAHRPAKCARAKAERLCDAMRCAAARSSLCRASCLANRPPAHPYQTSQTAVMPGLRCSPHVLVNCGVWQLASEEKRRFCLWRNTEFNRRRTVAANGSNR